MVLEGTKFRLAVTQNCLRSCPLFVGLPAPDLQVIAAMAIPKHLEKGDYLFHAGEPAVGFYVLQKGAINVHRVNAAGKEQVIHVFRPVESFAEGALVLPTGYPADARALVPSIVLLIPKTDFLELLRKRPELALRMLGSMSQHLRVVIGLLDDLTLKDIETRLANWLLRRCRRPLDDRPMVIELDRTKRVLAAEMGTTSETLSRTLGKFREQQLVRVSGNVITVVRPRALQELLKRHLGEL
jgi:CRP/FNR family transcriptional regulator